MSGKEVEENSKTVLTEEEQRLVAETLGDIPQSKETRIMNDIAEHGSGEVERVGYTKTVEVATDPYSGGNTIIGDVKATEQIEEKKEPITEIPENLGDMTEQEFSDFIDAYQPAQLNYEINSEDVKANIDSTIGEIEVDDATALELVKLLNKVKEGADVRFKELPESVRSFINNYMAKTMGIGPDNMTAKANEARNMIANELMQEYLKNIELSKYVDTYNYKVEHLFEDTTTEISPLFKMYNQDNQRKIEKLIEQADNPVGKKIAQDILDSINDGFNMERLIKVAPKIKMKKFEVDKPNRVFDYIHGKFNQSKNSLYNLYGCAHTLARHLYMNGIVTDKADARDVSVKIMLVFSKVVQNYNINDPASYSFMYYFTYNVFLLDLYKGDQYKEYTGLYFENIKKLIEVLR